MCAPSWTLPLQRLVEMPQLVSTEWTSGESCPQSRSMSKGRECFELQSFQAGLLCSDNWHICLASLGNAVLFTKIIALPDIAIMFPSIHLLTITGYCQVWTPLLTWCGFSLHFQNYYWGYWPFPRSLLLGAWLWVLLIILFARLFLMDWKAFFIYSGYESFARYTCCKYLLLVFCSSFSFATLSSKSWMIHTFHLFSILCDIFRCISCKHYLMAFVFQLRVSVFW